MNEPMRWPRTTRSTAAWPSGPCMIIAAHPDDEVIGASWFLRHGSNLTVVHVTDGAPRDARLRSPRAPREREDYAELRRREALHALALVGLGERDVRSLGLVDQEASHQLVSLARALERLLHELTPALVLVPPYEGGHPDHDACAFAARAALKLAEPRSSSPPALVEMTSYHRFQGTLRSGSFLPAASPTAERTRPLSPADRDLKRRMFDCFESQAEVLAELGLEDERFRPAPSYDFTRPPHQGTLHYEALGWPMSGHDWRALAASAQAELGLAREVAVDTHAPLHGRVRAPDVP